jgi:hypothetical protein
MTVRRSANKYAKYHVECCLCKNLCNKFLAVPYDVSGNEKVSRRGFFLVNALSGYIYFTMASKDAGV